MKTPALICIALSLTACASAPDPRRMIRVGTIPTGDTEIFNRNQIPAIPIGFKVTPMEAAAVIPQSLKCSRKCSLAVYADEANYYFSLEFAHLFNNVDVDFVRSVSAVVDGKTGELLRSPQRHDDGR